MNKVIGLVLGVFIGSVVLIAQPLGVLWSLPLALGIGGGVGALVAKIYAPEVKVGNVKAALVKDPKAVADKLEKGKDFLSMLVARQGQVKDPTVSGEINELIDDVTRLISYVEDHPSQYQSLGSFLSSYAMQADQVLSGYVTIEAYGGHVDAARENTINALNALEGAARGSLDHISTAQSTAVEASSEAINRLVSMQGYQPDENQSADTLNAASELKKLASPSNG
jgi:hypothetical protein